MTDADKFGDGDDQETWTAEEIEAWEDENEGVCPAFRVDHRPERKRAVTDRTEHPGQEDFEMPDAVFPTVGSTSGSVDVYIEQGRIRIREEAETEPSLGVANASIPDPTPVATLHAGIDQGDGDEIYAEFAFDGIDALRQLRYALTAAIEYREAQP